MESGSGTADVQRVTLLRRLGLAALAILVLAAPAESRAPSAQANSTERQVIAEESRIETDNPRSGIVRQLYGMVFGPHPYGRPVLGTPATMGAATQDNLKAFNRRFYTPENMALVVVGPVDAKDVRPMVDRTFGRRPRTGRARRIRSTRAMRPATSL